MSKKNLLNEATVRRFMKLANMQNLSDGFLTEMDMGPAYQADEDEMMDEPELAGDEGPQEEAPVDMEEPEAEVEEPEEEKMEEPEEEEVMEEPEAEEVEITEDDRDILAKAADILAKIAGGAAPAAEMDMEDMDMGEEAGMRDMDMMGEEMEMDSDLEEGMYEEEMEEGMYMKDELDEVELVDENDLVQEVTRRVAARLREAIKSRK